MSLLIFLFFGIALSYWLSALFEMTYSVIFPMIFHGLTNTLMGFFEVDYSLKYWICIIISTFLSILYLDKKDNFSKSKEAIKNSFTTIIDT